MLLLSTRNDGESSVTNTFITYRKRQNLVREVSWLTGLHPNVQKTFCSFCFIGIGKAIAQFNVHGENFQGSLKIRRNRNTFISCLTFVVYGIFYRL